jgi:hypothetical protein
MYQRGQRIPTLLELKESLLTRNPAFQPSTVLTLDTKNRRPGTSINNPTWDIPIPVKGVYACSLKSMCIPVTWPNLSSGVTFTVSYGAVVAFPTTFVLAPGKYSYNYYAGSVTYAQASAAAATDFKDDLVYILLRAFQGAITSIQIDPSNSQWTWTWDSSCVSVTSSSSDVTNFFKITNQSAGGPLTWTSSGTVDLTGPKMITFSSPELACGGFVSSGTNTQSYLCSCPVSTLNFGDVLSHEPALEHITYFGQASKFVSSLSLAIMDAGTNQLLPLDADWGVELKFYIIVQQ